MLAQLIQFHFIELLLYTVLLLVLNFCAQSFRAKSPYNIFQLPRAWSYLLRGRKIIDNQAAKLNHAPFSVPAPGTRVHVLSTKEHWKEIDDAQCNELSAHAATKEMFQPVYTLGGIEWSEYRNAEGMPATRAVRTALRNLPALIMRLQTIIENEFTLATKDAPNEGMLFDYECDRVVRYTMTTINTLFVYGEDTMSNREFVTRGIRFIDWTLITAEIMRATPLWLRYLISKTILGRELDRKYVFGKVGRLLTESRQHRNLEEEKRPFTVLESLIDVCPQYWDTERIVVDLNMIWMSTTEGLFATGTQLLQDIFTYCEHIPALRQEIEELYRDPKTDLEKLKFLESFMMESFRTNAFISVTAQRVAMKDVTFSDGYIAPAGHWICFNQRRYLDDPSVYPNPERFDPYRAIYKNRRFTDVGIDWPVWGVPKLACPGKYLVTMALKLMVIHILQNYECYLEKENVKQIWWRENHVPSLTTRLMMKRIQRF